MTKDRDSPMRISLKDERKENILNGIIELHAKEFDEELSLFRAEEILNFFVRTLGPSIYNQAIQDARGFMTEKLDRPAVPCWITYTNEKIHKLLRDNLHLSPMYSGQIEAEGPRYCPSIETKIVRFL